MRVGWRPLSVGVDRSTDKTTEGLEARSPIPLPGRGRDRRRFVCGTAPGRCRGRGRGVSPSHAQHEEPGTSGGHPQAQPRAAGSGLSPDRPCPLARAMHRRQAPFVVFFTFTYFLRIFILWSALCHVRTRFGRSHSRLIPTGAGSCDQWSRVALPSRRTSREGSELGRGACCESAARPRACAASCSGGARALKALWSWR